MPQLSSGSKKVILSLVLVLVLAIYVLSRRTETAPATPSTGTPTATGTPSGTPTSLPPAVPPSGNQTYKNGEYTGSVADAIYGNLQVKAIIQGGKLTDVQFLQYPNDRPRSTEISNNAMSQLKSEAIAAQNANVDIVSGATQTSQAFIESLKSALGQAS